MIRSLRIVSVLVLLVLLVGVSPSAALAQDKTLYWETYDVDITVQPDGCFRVVETQQLVFTSGTFRFGIRHIPTENTSSISDLAVSEAGGVLYRESDSGEPFTFSTSKLANELNIRYNFPPTSDDDRTMVVEYTVCGALLFYEGGDQLVWKAVPSNDLFPIQHASVTVHLPDGATVDNYDATGPQGTATLIDNNQGVRFEATEPIRAGSQDFAVRVQWPHGIVTGQPAGWQVAMDRQDQIKPVANVAGLALTVFLLVFGLLGLYLLWYSKGRDKPTKLPAEWIPEPPSDLPAGMAGTLIDEKADNKDVIATLVDLARRGVLAIQDESKPGLSASARPTSSSTTSRTPPCRCGRTRSCSSTSSLATNKRSACLTCARSSTPTWGRSSRGSTRPWWTKVTSPGARRAHVPSTPCSVFWRWSSPLSSAAS